MLIGIGEPAVERLKVSLRDRDAAPWVVDTLVKIRDGRTAAQPASSTPTGPAPMTAAGASSRTADERGESDAGGGECRGDEAGRRDRKETTTE